MSGASGAGRAGANKSTAIKQKTESYQALPNSYKANIAEEPLIKHQDSTVRIKEQECSSLSPAVWEDYEKKRARGKEDVNPSNISRKH